MTFERAKTTQRIPIDARVEVKPHLAEADSRIDLESFPAAYCYTASQWENVNPAIPISLLERHHSRLLRKAISVRPDL